MAITAINAVQKPDNDPMDKVIKGLTIANELFKIPVAWESIKKSQLEQQALQQKAAGIMRPDEAQKEHIVPAAPEEVGNQESQGLKSLLAAGKSQDENGAVSAPAGSDTGLAAVIGAVGPNEGQYDLKRFKNLQAFPQKIVDAKGNVTEVPSVNQEVKDKLIAQESDLRDKYTKESEPTEVAANHFQSLTSQIKKGTNAGDMAALSSFARIVNPEINRIGDSAAQAAEERKTIAEIAGDKFDKIFRGGREDILSPTQRAELYDSAKSAMADRLTSQSGTDSKYAGLADQSGFLQRNILNDWNLKAYGTDGPKGLADLVGYVRNHESKTGASDDGGLIGTAKKVFNQGVEFASNLVGGKDAKAGGKQNDSEKLLELAKKNGRVKAGK